MTLHDFKPWCTNRVLFALGAPCERCRGGHHWHAVATGCVQHSRLKSLVGAVEAYTHDRRGAYAGIRTFLAPSRFVREKVVHLGADPARVQVLLHGVEPAATAATQPGLPERFVLYAGRLSEEKGVRLLPALSRAIAPVPLFIAGGGPLEPWLRERTSATFRLLGHLASDVLAAVRSRATAVVVPSLFPETFGYAVAEAQLEGRVVVASRIGALEELVEQEVTGLLVTPGNETSLIAATRRVLMDRAAPGWGVAAREQAARTLSPATHTTGLVAAYEAAIRG
jgi:glycosyltransferase involved in cell wall biosynthesis